MEQKTSINPQPICGVFAVFVGLTAIKCLFLSWFVIYLVSFYLFVFGSCLAITTNGFNLINRSWYLGLSIFHPGIVLLAIGATYIDRKLSLIGFALLFIGAVLIIRGQLLAEKSQKGAQDAA